MKKLSKFIVAFLLSWSALQAQNVQWGYASGGQANDKGNAIAVDASGNVYTTGYYGNDNFIQDFDPGPATLTLPIFGGNNIFISKVNSAGNLVWAKGIGSSGDNKGLSVALDGTGNVIICGYFTNTVDFNPGAGIANLTSAGVADAFVLKLDSNGNYVWANQIGGTEADQANSVATDASGKVYITGYFKGNNIDFNPGVGTTC